MSVLMWGVNHTISELNNANIPVMLMPDDFKAHSKVKVDRHYYMKENMPSHFKVGSFYTIIYLQEALHIIFIVGEGILPTGVPQSAREIST